jgi:uncharacterized protein (TIGR03435 family)
MIRSLGVSLFAFLCSGAFGQPANPPRKFEIAAIKTLNEPQRVLSGYSASGIRLTLQGYTFLALVMEAYNLKTYQVVFGPSALPPVPEYNYYFIEARAEGEAIPTRDEFRQMLRVLLAERFNLKVHTEQKQMDVYALIIGKNGPKLKESAPDAVFSGYGGVNGRNQSMKQTKADSADIAQAIANMFGPDRPVVDKTGLAGLYDFFIEATPEWRINNDPQPEDVSVFSAVQDQLGLKLEPQKAMIDILVVDHMDKPSPN